MQLLRYYILASKSSIAKNACACDMTKCSHSFSLSIAQHRHTCKKKGILFIAASCTHMKLDHSKWKASAGSFFFSVAIPTNAVFLCVCKTCFPLKRWLEESSCSSTFFQIHYNNVILMSIISQSVQQPSGGSFAHVVLEAQLWPISVRKYAQAPPCC